MIRKSILSKRLRRRNKKLLSFETLEDRRVLNGIPIAVPDAQYYTAINTALSVTSSNDPMENDRDPEGSTLTASIVANPSHGSITNWSSSAGTFTYTPNNGYTGV